MSHRCRPRTPGLAEPPIRGIVRILQREQFQRQLVKPALEGAGVQQLGWHCSTCGTHEFAQSRGEIREKGLVTHAVFILPGWFSATARKKYVAAKRIESN